MRLRLYGEKNNPRAEDRRAWIVLSIALAALLITSGARMPRDGARVYVPVSAGDDASVSWRDGAPVIHINRADANVLTELPGIGERRAKAILNYREQNGNFTSVDELLSVPGISEKVLEGIRDRIRID